MSFLCLYHCIHTGFFRFIPFRSVAFCSILERSSRTFPARVHTATKKAINKGVVLDRVIHHRANVFVLFINKVTDDFSQSPVPCRKGQKSIQRACRRLRFLRRWQRRQRAKLLVLHSTSVPRKVWMREVRVLLCSIYNS